MRLHKVIARLYKAVTPLIGPFKGINGVDKDLVRIYVKHRILKDRFLANSRGPRGFRELREAGWNFVHLSWKFSDSMVPNYG